MTFPFANPVVVVITEAGAEEILSEVVEGLEVIEGIGVVDVGVDVVTLEVTLEVTFEEAVEAVVEAVVEAHPESKALEFLRMFQAVVSGGREMTC